LQVNTEQAMIKVTISTDTLGTGSCRMRKQPFQNRKVCRVYISQPTS
jgi:hypothetical protein